MNKISIEASLEKAKARRKERDKNINIVNHKLRDYFKKICPDKAHDSLVIAEDYYKFRVYIFYKKIQDVHIHDGSGVSSKIKDFVYDELERQGRGNKASVTVFFEFDSDENVQSNFDGDYYSRLR